jgi:hypothetical protein
MKTNEKSRKAKYRRKTYQEKERKKGKKNERKIKG